MLLALFISLKLPNMYYPIFSNIRSNIPAPLADVSLHIQTSKYNAQAKSAGIQLVNNIRRTDV